MSQKLLTEPRIILFYISLLLYPVSTRLSIAHGIKPADSLFDPLSTIISISLIFGLLTFTLFIAKKRPLIVFCILFFFLNHIIESTVFPLELIFEHRNYIPSMLFFVPVAIGFSYLFNYYTNKRAMQYILFGFIVCVLIGLGHSTFIRNFTWKNPKSLWIDAVEKAPDLFRPFHNIGRYYDDMGHEKKAIFWYKKALEKPFKIQKNEEFVTYYNLARIYANLKNYSKALKLYQKALALNPAYAPIYNNITGIFDHRGRHDLAFKYLIEAARLDPDSPVTNLNLGIHYLKDGQPDMAIIHLNKLTNSHEWRYYTNLYLGIAFKEKGLLGKAMIGFRKASNEQPKSITPHLHMAEIFYRAGDHEKAEQEAELIIGLVKDTGSFQQIMDDLHGRGRKGKLHASSTIVIPLIRTACLTKSETFKKWGNTLNVEDELQKEKEEKN